MITKRRVRKLDEKRLAKKKVEMEYEKRRLSLSNEMRSMSDPQLNQIALRKKVSWPLFLLLKYEYIIL